MSAPDSFWNIRFAVTARRMFSTIPRGEADVFGQAIELLRKGPRPPGVEQIGDNLYEYRFNNYRIAFEVVYDTANTVRVTAFEQET